MGPGNECYCFLFVTVALVTMLIKLLNRNSISPFIFNADILKVTCYVLKLHFECSIGK